MGDRSWHAGVADPDVEVGRAWERLAPAVRSRVLAASLRLNESAAPNSQMAAWPTFPKTGSCKLDDSQKTHPAAPEVSLSRGGCYNQDGLAEAWPSNAVLGLARRPERVDLLSFSLSKWISKVRL